ncbi:MAG TPA: alpha/beta hydrolase [Thermoleophilaceae bacterium]|nr:alpha/beta hydrolase [Thermoleophilaceae bacterium]
MTSRDGSRIAYDRLGSGPAVILVGGALGYRKFKKMEELAKSLAEHCTVINYDRRGRGDSTEVKPFALEREIEDIAALIEAAGGSASLWGWSSGGALALRAAGRGVGVERLSVYEVPFMVTPEAKRPTPDYGERLEELVAAGDRSGAVKHFMRNAVGVPAPFVALMRLMPMWKGLEATAHTLPYDWAALGRHTMYGAPLDAEEWAPVAAPTLVVHGAKSPAVLKQGSRALAEVLPNAELRELEGVSHNVKMDVLAPVLAEFFTRKPEIGVPGEVRPATA